MKNLIRPLISASRPLWQKSLVSRNTVPRALTLRPTFAFCQNKITVSDVAPENLQIKHEEVLVGEQLVDSFTTKGSLSILSHLKGTKNTESGELYALMFTCTKCNTKAIRSFTKTAYHKGVVLIRCEGCQNVHLIADNLGWFEDEPTNLDQLSGGTVKKVHDPIAISRFLHTALGGAQKEKQCGGQCNQSKQNCQKHEKTVQCDQKGCKIRHDL